MTATPVHEMLTEFVWPDRASTVPAHIVARCTCGGWSASRPHTSRNNTLRDAHREHQHDVDRDQQEQAQTDALAWYARTGHCADCGQPGDWCQCLHPCRCQTAHETGSGVGRDPADLFTAADTHADQGSLW